MRTKRGGGKMKLNVKMEARNIFKREVDLYSGLCDRGLKKKKTEEKNRNKKSWHEELSRNCGCVWVK